MPILRVRREDGTWAEIPAIVGEKGDKGDTGAQGIQGEKGEKGDTGAQGAKGETGERGAQGEKGEKGDPGYTPIKGVDYFDGAPGKDGTNGTNGKDGANGKDGVSATHSWNGTTLTITSASGTSSADLKGEKGEKGDTGAQGIQGIQGVQGEKGEKGDSIKGDKGDKGDTGATGAKGDKGDKGDPGEVDYSRLNNYLPLAGGTITGNVAVRTVIMPESHGGARLGVDACRFGAIFGMEYYFANVNPNYTSPYKFGMYQWDDNFTFVTRNAANTHLADAWQINGATGVTNFSQRPTVTGYPVATQNEVPSKTETWTFTLEDGSTVTKAVYIG